MTRLTPKQKSFVLEYLVDRNGKQAAIRAGYGEKSAEVTASRLLRNVKVKQYVDTCTTKQHAKLRLDADLVLRELVGILTSDPADLLDEDGCLKKISTIPPSVRKAISAIEVKETFDSTGKKTGEIKRIKLWSKTESAKMLGQHLKLWIDAKTLGEGVFDYLAHLTEARSVIDVTPKAPGLIHDESTTEARHDQD